MRQWTFYYDYYYLPAVEAEALAVSAAADAAIDAAAAAVVLLRGNPFNNG